ASRRRLRVAPSDHRRTVASEVSLASPNGRAINLDEPASRPPSDEPSKGLTTSWSGCRRGAILGLLKQLVRPPPPALGHSGNRKQPVGFVAIACVDAKHIANGEIVIGSLGDADRIAGPHVTFDYDSQVSPGPQRLGEAAREQLIIHPNSKPPARNSRLAHLENRGPNLPTLADERLVRVNPECRKVFAKLTGCKG